jgi:hypothetical protein
LKILARKSGGSRTPRAGGALLYNLCANFFTAKLRDEKVQISSSPLFPYPYPSPTRTPHNPFSKKQVPPPLGSFVMCVLIKDLRRSVVYVCANKGLRLCSGNFQVAIRVSVSHVRRQRPNENRRHATVATRSVFLRGSFRIKTSNALHKQKHPTSKNKHPLQTKLPTNIPKNKKPAPTSRG